MVWPLKQNQTENQNQNSNNDNNDNNNSNNDNNNDNKNNNNSNMESQVNPWDNTQNNENNNNNNNNNQNQNQNQQNQNAAEMFQKHIESLNLTGDVDYQKIMADIQAGNTESLQQALNDISGNTYKAAMTQMNTVMQKKIEKAVETAVKQSSEAVNSNLAIKDMNKEMAFTTDPAIAPVAEAALKSFIDKGDDSAVAINKVKQFFDTTASKIAGIDIPSADEQGNRQFSDFSSNNNSNNEGDWLETLTAHE